MPTVFAGIISTVLLFYIATLILAYTHLLPTGLHMLWGLLMTLLIVLLQCLIFGFFIGSGKTIKRVALEKGLPGDWADKTREYKNRSYPALMWAILATVLAAGAGGGVSTGLIPMTAHQILVWAAFVMNAVSFWISYRVIVENVRAIHQINGIIQERDKKGETQVERVKILKEEKSPSSAQSRRPQKFFFLSAAVWIPYFYMRYSLGSRTFPFWPFLALSLLFLVLGAIEVPKTLKE